MKKIVLTAAALLAISGSAFAGSDHFGSNAATPAATVDSTYTASVKKSEPAEQKPVQGADHNLYGNN
ncbi:MAG: DUF680 domain-containing protein [Mesorhizobium sp.]|uniref:DUF680 domain-containing protein n=1 Tax=Mesorhizobium sp. TaxID=1871066 RepID=UPI001AC45520|nr:DUF680 domain-containing protein [Mesorhizobium sp.]MBN9222191.1 DUF680 domain-containing protein [Mesorhizobium sp.]